MNSTPAHMASAPPPIYRRNGKAIPNSVFQLGDIAAAKHERATKLAAARARRPAQPAEVGP